VEDELSDLSDDDEYILPPRSAVDKLKHLKQVPVFTTKQSIKELFSNTGKVMSQLHYKAVQRIQRCSNNNGNIEIIVVFLSYN